MNKDFERLGVWMDFKNAYQSVKDEFIEGVWWLVKKAHENKRLYEADRSMSWCASCATALAKHELEYHHIHHVALGGKNTTDNIVTLCKKHHRMVHRSTINFIPNKKSKLFPWKIDLPLWEKPKNHQILN